MNATPSGSGKVIFNQGSVEDLFIGSVRVEEHLRVTGEREAFVVREVLSRWTSGSWNRVTAWGTSPVFAALDAGIGALWGNAGGDIGCGSWSAWRG